MRRMRILVITHNSPSEPTKNLVASMPAGFRVDSVPVFRISPEGSTTSMPST